MKTPIFYILTLTSLLIACDPKGDQTTDTEQKEHAHESHGEEPTDVIELTADQIRLGEIKLGTVSYRNLTQVLSVNGKLAVPPQNQVSITALQGGFVRSLPIMTGQPVRKGQVLARIENPDLIQLQQEYAENHSRLTFLEAEYARQKELSQQAVSALKVFQQTTAELSATRARLAGLAQRIQRVGLSPKAVLNGQFSAFYVITAPVAGVITNVTTNTGQYLQPADVLAQLVSNEGVYAELTVFEKDLPQIREGQRFTFRLTNEAERERTGRISFINQAIEADRSVRVVARLDQDSGKLTPNTFLKASLNLGNNRVTALPEGAIVNSEGKDYIFIVTTEEAHHEHREVGTEADHTCFKQIQVRRGVTENGYSAVVLPGNFDIAKTQVVIQGAYAVLSQLKAASGEEEGHAH
ncbi:efflux RND transporter periplasmic adaptor subunit [Tellurirhabdus bombi]|uniref:efflux RND transporter periplasmic adaptor subunit n=1 Tax=Tellurirhabdus bombi TaxID=2907205 RepID=UPI001F37CBEA|nr:efflux RND transporter periplasmic adaptor subunit [Tellurirhabdus bombi]